MSECKSNIVLIGMPGAGKSTVGVLLAKAARKDFLDSDVVIQARQGRGLQEIINNDGLDRFRDIEQQAIVSLDCRDTVIATGGSVVYSDEAMQHLAAMGVVVFLDVPLGELKQRLGDITSRGVVLGPDMTIDDLYAERLPLYRRWADITVACSEQIMEETVAEVIVALPTHE